MRIIIYLRRSFSFVGDCLFVEEVYFPLFMLLLMSILISQMLFLLVSRDLNSTSNAMFKIRDVQLRVLFGEKRCECWVKGYKVGETT